MLETGKIELEELMSDSYVIKVLEVFKHNNLKEKEMFCLIILNVMSK